MKFRNEVRTHLGNRKDHKLVCVLLLRQFFAVEMYYNAGPIEIF